MHDQHTSCALRRHECHAGCTSPTRLQAQQSSQGGSRCAPVTCRPPAVRARSQTSLMRVWPSLPPPCTSGSKSRVNLRGGQRDMREEHASEAQLSEGEPGSGRAHTCFQANMGARAVLLCPTGRTACSDASDPSSSHCSDSSLTPGTAPRGGWTGSRPPPPPSGPGCAGCRPHPSAHQFHPTASQTWGQ